MAATGTSYAYSYRVGSVPYQPSIPESYWVIETHCVAADLTDTPAVVAPPTSDEEANSLTIKGRTIHWHEGGQEHTAPLCPGD